MGMPSDIKQTINNLLNNLDDNHITIDPAILIAEATADIINIVELYGKADNNGNSNQGA